MVAAQEGLSEITVPEMEEPAPGTAGGEELQAGIIADGTGPANEEAMPWLEAMTAQDDNLSESQHSALQTFLKGTV
ncbi:unnamed protein product [Lampetra planeri]